MRRAGAPIQTQIPQPDPPAEMVSRLERTRRPPAGRGGKVGAGGPAGGAPARLVGTTQHRQPAARSTRAPAYARRRRHFLAHLLAEPSPQYG